MVREPERELTDPKTPDADKPPGHVDRPILENDEYSTPIGPSGNGKAHNSSKEERNDGKS